MASQRCLFTARGPFEHLLSATREELTADTALLPSLQHTRERGSREGLDSPEAHQKRQRTEQLSAVTAATSPLARMKPRSGTLVPKGTAKIKHSAVDYSQSSKLATEAASASVVAQELAEDPREPSAAAGQVHIGPQVPSSDGDLYLRKQQTEPPAEQQEPTVAGLQGALGSKASDASKQHGNSPSNKVVGHAKSSFGRARAGSVTAAQQN